MQQQVQLIDGGCALLMERKWVWSRRGEGLSYVDSSTDGVELKRKPGSFNLHITSDSIDPQ